MPAMLVNECLSKQTLIPSFAGIVLAGGQSTRMGSQNKALIEYQNKPLIEYALEQSLSAASIKLISAGPNHYCHPNLKHYIQLPDDGSQGPLAGIFEGLKWLNTETDLEWLAVSPCDTPLAPSNWVQRLLLSNKNQRNETQGNETQSICTQNINAQKDVCYVRHHDRDHYAHSVWHKSVINNVQDALANHRLAIRHLLQTINAQAVDLTHHYANTCFANINTPNSLAQVANYDKEIELNKRSNRNDTNTKHTNKKYTK